MRLSEGTFVRVAGNGPAVVFIHGIGLDHSIWSAQLAAFSGRATTIAYDIVGHGGSSKPQIGHSMALYVEQLRRVLDELGHERAVIVGFSLGSLIARAFAIRYPHRVLGLALLHTWFMRTSIEMRRVAERLALASASGPEVSVAPALVRWFSDTYREKFPETLDYVARLLRANDHHSFIAAYTIVADEGTPEVDALDNISCPTLVMTAQQDYGNSPGMSMRVSENIPGSELVVLDGLRHMALLEDPDAINRPLIRLFERAIAAAA